MSAPPSRQKHELHPMRGLRWKSVDTSRTGRRRKRLYIASYDVAPRGLSLTGGIWRYTVRREAALTRAFATKESSPRISFMKHVSRARVVILSLAIAGGAIWVRPPHVATAAPQPQQVASVDQLKTEAFKALRAGHFDQTNELLTRAAVLSHDPSVERMAAWTSNFEHQREEFAAERHTQFQKSLDNMNLLLGHQHPDYALDSASRAYGLADAKDTFSNDPQVSRLVSDSIARAEDYDHNEQWAKSLRLYSDLSIMQPAVPTWKDDLKLAARRLHDAQIRIQPQRLGPLLVMVVIFGTSDRIAHQPGHLRIIAEGILGVSQPIRAGGGIQGVVRVLVAQQQLHVVQRLLKLRVALGGKLLALMLEVAGPSRHALDRGIVGKHRRAG